MFFAEIKSVALGYVYTLNKRQIVQYSIAFLYNVVISRAIYVSVFYFYYYETWIFSRSRASIQLITHVDVLAHLTVN